MQKEYFAMLKPLSKPSWIALSVLSLAIVAGCAHMRGHGHHNAKVLARAVADVQGDGLTGTATFMEFENAEGRAVHVVLKVKGDPAKLTPGLHGVHLHAVGECVPPFTSAGGHYDPGPAANTDPDVNHPYHMGDLPNLRINDKGEGELDAVTTRVTISAGPLSLFDADGSAIIIHKNPDQGISGAPKSGVSGGPRIACGVIRQAE
jgi:Cu-Zn family superoxide dismutase